MRCLDLFCCGGGAGMGYHLAGMEVVGVDIEPQPKYPFAFVQEDALEYLAAHGHEFDFIHASPPCQGYSHLTPAKNKGDHERMIPAVRELMIKTGKPYVIENVAGARAAAQTLRGGAGMTHNTPGAVMVFASVCNSLGTLGGYVAARAGEPA